MLIPDFLLADNGDRSSRLFEIAKDCPVCEFRPPLSYASNPARLWFSDSGMEKALCAAGAGEELLPPGASDYEKFRALAVCLPHMAGHPVFAAVRYELSAVFGIDAMLCEENCDEIWRSVSEKLNGAEEQTLRCGNGPRFIPTAPDVLPSPEGAAGAHPVFSPDVLISPDAPGFPSAVRALAAATHTDIADFSDFCHALTLSADAFSAAGCRTARQIFRADGGFTRPDPYHAGETFRAALAGRRIAREDASLFEAQMLRMLCLEYRRRGWALILRVGAGDGVCDVPRALREAFSYLDAVSGLPRTVLSFCDPNLPPALSDLFGLYQPISGIPRLFAGIDGERADPSDLPALTAGLFRAAGAAAAVGMISDWNSFISHPVQGYFRKELCTFLSGSARRGLLPESEALLADTVRRVCAQNLLMCLS